MSFKQIYTQILGKYSKKQDDVVCRIQEDTKFDENSQYLNLPISYISAQMISVPSLEKETVIACKNYEKDSVKQIKNFQQMKSNELQDYKCMKNGQIIQSMLALQAKWICKQKQIKQYVQLLERTIDEKNAQIEKVEFEKTIISGKFSQVQKQKNTIFIKLNQIHQNLKLQQKNKPVPDQRLNIQIRGQFSGHNLQLSTQIQQKYKSDGQRSKQEKQVKNNSAQNLDNSNFQTRILTNIMKLIEQNFLNYRNSDCQGGYQKCTVKQKTNNIKQRQIRATTSTDDAFLQQNQKLFKKVKIQNKQTSTFDNRTSSFGNKIQNFSNQNIQPLKGCLEKTENYKSAKTITFNRQQQYQNYLNIVKNTKAKYFSQNRIQSSENQIQLSEQKMKEHQSITEFPKTQNNEELTRKIRDKKYSLNSEIVYLIENGNICYLKNDPQNYSLSSSFISDSQIDTSNQDFQDTFREQTLQNKRESSRLEQKTQAAITKKQVLQNIYQQGTCLQDNMPNKSQFNKSIKPSRSQNIKPNLQNTHTKKSQFPPVEQGNQKTEVKSRNFQIFDQMNCNIEGQRRLIRQANPETKCTSFQESSLSNNFYNQKSVSCSQNSFKSLNVSSELNIKFQPLVARMNLEKTAFENEMLKCYNGVLDKKIKPLSKTQKLRGRFQTQNNCLLSKLNSKKSIS